MNNTYAIGDIHGGARALIKALELANFDNGNDTLISLGDVCDGWSETAEAIEELLKIKNLIYIKGNHDHWAYKGLSKDPEFLKGFHSEGATWLHHGGQATVDSYNRRPELIEKHLPFLKNARPYYLDSENRLFVHAGIMPGKPIHETSEDILIWDRDFWYGQYSGKNYGKDYKEIYIGHTPTLNFPDNKGSHYLPMNKRNTWNLDTGAAFTGKLTIMNIDTKEYWQTEPVMEYYPLEKGRNKQPFVARPFKS